jgi:hypothetical protein
MDLRPILVRYRLQLTGGEHVFFALGGGNILFYTPNVGISCTDFLAHAKTWVFRLLVGAGAHHSEQSDTHRCYKYRFLHILPSLLASTIILGRPWTYP